MLPVCECSQLKAGREGQRWWRGPTSLLITLSRPIFDVGNLTVCTATRGCKPNPQSCYRALVAAR